MNKDESIDRLLSRTARARADAGDTGACLDPETLAAWTDGTLSARERTEAEAHTADCDRCLAVVAAIAKTTPPPSSPQGSRWLSVRWLVPLTTAAVAVTAWMVVQELEPTPEPVTAPMQERSVATPPTASSADAVQPIESAGRRERDTASERRADALEKKQVEPQRGESRTKDREAPRALADAVARKPDAAAAPAEPLARFEAADQGTARQLPAAGQPPNMIVSPDPQVRWRIVDRAVERSTDGGVSWSPQPAGTGVEPLAGASPAPTVCWIVGRRGLVLLSTDGETWRRLAFPDEKIDIVAVTARDAATAAVTVSDGRTFGTTDGGRTWTPQAGRLQEIPAAPF